MIISLIIIAIITWIEFYALISKILTKNSIKNRFLRPLYKAISLLYLSLLVFFIFSIESYYLNLKIYLLYSVFVAILSDIGGLVFGKTFKGKKLTKISPNKTISGSIGSFVFSLILIPLFYEELIKYNFIILVLITIIISLTSQLGDLFISYLKRKAKIKNTSDILPGHGGFLDRVDGIIFAIPVGILLFNLF
jgi:phosphatidate cytidylyltransferase|tara:strand:- start:519 stop:1097 length:579 start_codon:yes stop_codon:yes gene_type:complete